MSSESLVLATAEPGVLSEGPFWDPVRRSIHWVDIRRGEVLTGTLAEDGTIDVADRVPLPGTVGAMAPSAKGDWIVANGDDLVMVRDGRVVRTIPVLGSDGSRRFNDGKPDAAGRYLVGTLSEGGSSEREELLVVERDGSRRVLDDDLTRPRVGRRDVLHLGVPGAGDHERPHVRSPSPASTKPAHSGWGSPLTPGTIVKRHPEYGYRSSCSGVSSSAAVVMTSVSSAGPAKATLDVCGAGTSITRTSSPSGV